MNRISFVVTLAITFTSASGWADAPQDTLERIIDTRTIRLGYLKDLAPFSFVGADGRPRGYSVELCHRIVAGIRNNYGMPVLDIEWVEVTSASRFQRVADGSIDLECGASGMSLTRLRLVDFSAMTWIDSKSFLVRRGESLRTAADLAGKKLAAVEGTHTEKVLHDLILGQVVGGRPVTTEVVAVKDRREGVDALLRGSVYAFAADRMVLAGLAKSAPDPSQLALADYQFAYEAYAFPLRRNEADFRFAVNQVLAGLYRGGAVKEIAQRWFGDLGPLPPLLDSLYDINGLRD